MKKLFRPSARLLVTAACFALGCGGSEFRAVGDETGGGGSGGDGSSASSGATGAVPFGRAGAGSGSGAGNAQAGNAQAGNAQAGNAQAGNAQAGGTAAGSAGSANTGSSAGGSKDGAGAVAGAAGAQDGSAGSGSSKPYLGPTVGTAKPFAALAYSAITAANISTLIGDIGVSAGAVSTITGFDAASDKKYGTDSLAPDSGRTLLAQQGVTALVSDIDLRPCDADYTSVVGGLTGDVTLYPGVTCMNSFSDDVLLNGHVTLDARGDHNAFFIIRGNLTLTVADAAQVMLANGAEACGVFWRISKQVTIGKAVQFYGTVIAGSAVTMTSGSKLTGRVLAQTASVTFDADAVTIPSDGLVASAAVCTHLQ
jgi:Ice-binding-like